MSKKPAETDYPTYSLRIDGVPVELTRISAVPGDIPRRLAYKQPNRSAVDLILYGEAHTEHKLRDELANVIRVNKDVVGSGYLELDDYRQLHLNEYMNYGRKMPDFRNMQPDNNLFAGTRRTIDKRKLTPLDYNVRRESELLNRLVQTVKEHAPSMSESELRQEFFDSERNFFRTLKATRTHCKTFDELDGKAIEASHAKYEKFTKKADNLELDKDIFAHFYDEKGKFVYLHDKDYEKMIAKIQENVSKDWKVASDFARTEFPDAGTLRSEYRYFCSIIGVPGGTYELKEFESAYQKQLDEYTEIASMASDENIRLRNIEMAKYFQLPFIAADGIRIRSEGHLDIGLVGKDHLFNCTEATGDLVKEIIARAKQERNNINIVTVDLVPVEKADIEKLGGRVFVGGKPGADITVFVEGRRRFESVEDVTEIPFTRSKNIRSQYLDLVKPEVDDKKLDIDEILKNYEQKKDKKTSSIVPTELMRSIERAQVSGVQNIG